MFSLQHFKNLRIYISTGKMYKITIYRSIFLSRNILNFTPKLQFPIIKQTEYKRLREKT